MEVVEIGGKAESLNRSVNVRLNVSSRVCDTTNAKDVETAL